MQDELNKPDAVTPKGFMAMLEKMRSDIYARDLELRALIEATPADSPDAPALRRALKEINQAKLFFAGMDDPNSSWNREPDSTE